MVETKDSGLLFKQITTFVTKSGNNYLQDKGLTTTQVRYLNFIYNHRDSEVPMKEFESVYEVAQPTVAGIVRRLEDKQFIITETSPDDRRSKNIRLTKKGEAFIKENPGYLKQVQDYITEALTDSEEKELNRLLNKIYNRLAEDR